MADQCPGAVNIKGTPTLKIKVCPACGSEIELFSSEMSSVCKICGFIAYNDTQSCIQWCSKARECVGDEMYQQLMNKNGQ